MCDENCDDENDADEGCRRGEAGLGGLVGGAEARGHGAVHEGDGLVRHGGRGGGGGGERGANVGKGKRGRGWRGRAKRAGEGEGGGVVEAKRRR